MYDTLFMLYWKKNENATLQYFIFREQVLDEKYFLNPDIQQTTVETPTICLFWCLSYVPFCILSFIHSILQLRMPTKDCNA